MSSRQIAKRFLILGMNGRIEALSRDTQHLGQKLPRPFEGFPLEIVADRKVAEHEEKGAVALITDFVDIDRAKTLLDRTIR